jgi:hypothetical protein
MTVKMESKLIAAVVIVLVGLLIWCLWSITWEISLP